jgi:hypothetical protein
MIDKEVMDLGGGAYTPIREREKKMAKKEKMVSVDIELDNTSFLLLAKRAHELDITFNQLIIDILRKQIGDK